jgi:uncharacterized membrane protein
MMDLYADIHPLEIAFWAVLIVAITAAVAHRKNRDPFWWGVLAALTGGIALVVVLIIKGLPEEKP